MNPEKIDPSKTTSTLAAAAGLLQTLVILGLFFIPAWDHCENLEMFPPVEVICGKSTYPQAYGGALVTMLLGVCLAFGQALLLTAARPVTGRAKGFRLFFVAIDLLFFLLDWRVGLMLLPGAICALLSLLLPVRRSMFIR